MRTSLPPDALEGKSEERKGKIQPPFLPVEGTLLPKQGSLLLEEGWVLVGEEMFLPEVETLLDEAGTSVVKEPSPPQEEGAFLPKEEAVSA